MATIRRFEDLQVWRQARAVACITYTITSNSRFNDVTLIRQMRRASVSILSNIAEGFGRNTDKEFVQFLYISRGSTLELQSQYYIALDQRMINSEQFDRMYEALDHTSRLITNLIKYLRISVSHARA